jgi:putative ABC transport system ATP-binding protein
MSSAIEALAVRCRGVTKGYGEGGARVQALRGVDLDVRRGELLVLSGPSGCGKTTLLSIISGILDADAGSCEVLGREPARLDEDARAGFRLENLGFVYQAFNLLPALSACENVSVPLLLGGVARAVAEERARAALHAVGLGGRGDALPPQLSGGQQQRVAIARALVHAPALVVCDEPTSNLDHAAGQEAMALLRSLAASGGRTVLVVTHDPRVVAFADRVAHMEDGRVVGIEPAGSSRGAPA